MNRVMYRNWGFDLVRATEAAAIAAGRWMGLGKKDEADQAATEAMHAALNAIDMDGYVVIGEEGKLGKHSPLDSGMRAGTGNGPAMDVVVDAIDGRTLLAQGHPGAVSVAGIAPRGTMSSLSPAVYLDKLVVDREVAPSLVSECLDAPAGWVLALVARKKKKKVQDLIVFVLDRPRHVDLIEEVRTAGARVMLRSDGDITGALMAASIRSGVDVLMGTGGAPEGVIAACAVKALGGAMLARLTPQTEAEQQAVQAASLDPKRIYTCDDIISGDEVYFAATGITDGALLDGARYHGDRAETESLILRAATHTRRKLHAEHAIQPG